MSTRTFGIRGAQPQKSREAVCLRCDRVVAIGDRNQILELLAGHYGQVHGYTGSMVLVEAPEGRTSGDFTTHPAPFRCDLCGEASEPPWWTMVTPPEPGVYDLEDPNWLICDPCADLVERRDTMGLVRRYLSVATRVYAVDRPEAREIALDLIPPFLDHVDPSQSERHSRYEA